MACSVQQAAEQLQACLKDQRAAMADMVIGILVKVVNELDTVAASAEMTGLAYSYEHVMPIRAIHWQSWQHILDRFDQSSLTMGNA